MVLARYSLDDFYIVSGVGLSNQCTYYFPHPYQMNLQIVNCMCRVLPRSHSLKILKPLD